MALASYQGTADKCARSVFIRQCLAFPQLQDLYDMIVTSSCKLDHWSTLWFRDSSPSVLDSRLSVYFDKLIRQIFRHPHHSFPACCKLQYCSSTFHYIILVLSRPRYLLVVSSCATSRRAIVIWQHPRGQEIGHATRFDERDFDIIPGVYSKNFSSVGKYQW